MATTVGKPEVCPACLLPALRAVLCEQRGMPAVRGSAQRAGRSRPAVPRHWRNCRGGEGETARCPECGGGPADPRPYSAECAQCADDVLDDGCYAHGAGL